MGAPEVVDLSSDDEGGKAELKSVKKEPPGFAGCALVPKQVQAKSQQQCRKRDPVENRSSPGQSCSSVLDQMLSPASDTGFSAPSPLSPAPLCRQFWKSGNYDYVLASNVTLQNAKTYMHVHPTFLHSNATSHKWAFGALAELIDNAVDEIQNGATFVIVDKTSNPRDGSPALLIQDNGGGMSPEALRHCMSFGFSDKKSKSAIGQYGNGFKTSSMRLGADVIVFSSYRDDRIWTQSIGLLSYTFLTQTGLDRIVVPMVGYELNKSTGSLQVLHGKEHFTSNLSILLQWSPYSSEAELLKQFDDIGPVGTKIIIYNLWFNDDGKPELDFDSDLEDIQLSGEKRSIQTTPAWKAVIEQHISFRFHYSLRAYLSILYLKIPEGFDIILRHQAVMPHNIADDLKFPEYILYKPQSGGRVEGAVVTTIGFLKEAPYLNIHGFNVYHKNRLILPFWQVANCSGSRGRGVVGVLQADFVEPTHNKQDFAKTLLLLKLEVRLKEMTWEYWDTHCVLIGYQQGNKPRVAITPQSSSLSVSCGLESPVHLLQSSSIAGNRTAAFGKFDQLKANLQSSSMKGFPVKRKAHNESIDVGRPTKRTGEGANGTSAEQCPSKQAIATTCNLLMDQKRKDVLEEQKKLKSRCLEFEKKENELKLKVVRLRAEIKLARHGYDRLLSTLQA